MVQENEMPQDNCPELRASHVHCSHCNFHKINAVYREVKFWGVPSVGPLLKFKFMVCLLDNKLSMKD